MKIAIIDCGSQKTPHIFECVDEFIDSEVIMMFDANAERLAGFQGVIISGAPILLSEIDPTRYLIQFNWIRNWDKPLLGICFGHQILGMLHGSEISRMSEDRDWQTIEAFVDSPLMDKLPNEVQMMEDHCETISIPPHFKLVGSSDACINEMMQHHSKPWFGVQFHPEVSGNQGRTLIGNFCELVLNPHKADNI